MSKFNPGPSVSNSVNQAPSLPATWTDSTGTSLVKPDGTSSVLYVDPGVSPYVGQVATRSNIPYGYNAAAPALMSRTGHFARETITSIQVVYSNWYVDTTNNTGTFQELGTGTTATIKVGFETAAGITSQILFSGSASGTVTSGNNIVSDRLSVNLSPGDKFYLRPSWVNTGGILYMPDKADPGFGDRFEFGATDKTLTGTIGNDLPGYAHFPTAIIAWTNKRSAYLLGTSRTFGYNDTADGVTGDIGIQSRWVGPSWAYCNAGVPADSLVRFLTYPTKRALIANSYYSDVFIEHGVNDNTRTLSQKQADFASAWALFPGKRMHAITVSPNTTGAWTLPSGTDQTNLQGSSLIDLNAWLLTKPAPLAVVHDVATLQSIPGIPTKWRAPGYTDDGLHPIQRANLSLVGVLMPNS